MKKAILFFIAILLINYTYSQKKKKEERLDKNGLIVKNAPLNQENFDINPLAPAKAAFYSAILPGLGQAYNKRYWMIPVIYGGIGGSIYAYDFNNKKYNSFLTAYKLDKAGKPHQFENLDSTALERGINGYKKQRDLWLFITIGVYILNIVEANVDAHLPNKKMNTNLSYKPSFTIDPVTNKMNYGANVSFKF